MGPLHRPGHHAPGCLLLGPRLAQPCSEEASRSLLSTGSAAGMSRLRPLSLPLHLSPHPPSLSPHHLFWCVVCVLSTAGALWLVHGEEWAEGETTVWDSNWDTGGGPGQPVSISGTPQPCPVALLLNVVHCSRPSLPSNHRCESEHQCVRCFVCLLVCLFCCLACCG